MIHTIIMLHLLVAIFAVTTTASGQEYTQLPGLLKWVSGSVNYVWGATRNGDAFFSERPSINWQHVGNLVQVDVDDTHVWGVCRDNKIYKRPIDGSGGWLTIPGELSQVSASGHGYIWGVNQNYQIFKCKKPCTGDWVRVPGNAKQVDGGQKEVYAVSDVNTVFSYPVDGQGPMRIIQTPYDMKHITASAVHDVYAIDIQDRIYRCRKPCIGNWENLSGRLSQIDGGPNAVFGVNSKDVILRHDLPL